MLFTRNKEQELWRYVCAPAIDAMNGQPQQPHHHQHQPHPPLTATMATATAQPPSAIINANDESLMMCECDEHLSSSFNCNYGPMSLGMSVSMSTTSSMPIHGYHHQSNTPPPPYSSKSCGIDCSGLGSTSNVLLFQNVTPSTCPTELDADTDVEESSSMPCNCGHLSADDDGDDSLEDGCIFAKCGDSTSGGMCNNNATNKWNGAVADQITETGTATATPTDTETACPKNVPHILRISSDQNEQLTKTPATTAITTAAAATTTTTTRTATSVPATADTFASSVVNIFRSCCGAGSGSSISSMIDTTAATAPAPATNSNINHNNNVRNYKLQNCKTIRRQHAATTTTAAAATTPTSASTTTHDYFKELMRKLKPQQKSELLKAVKTPYEPASSKNCILIKRVKIFNEEPFVIACRLFLWSNLKSATELRLSPICPNQFESVYVCCNPLHWYRIIPTEPSIVSSLQHEDEDYDFGKLDSSYGIPTAKIMMSGSYMQVPESLATDGEDNRSAMNWCRVAYWELSQRIGDCYAAKKSPINIYTEGSSTCIDGLCLKELAESKQCTAHSPDKKLDKVRNIRERIGLGIMLNKEADGVWLYNRSMESIYLYSPSLQESWNHCLRVPSGHCLRAFDSHRAQIPIYTSQLSNFHVGPVDLFSMCISFVKGWGYHYKRRDITGCPCWIEVFFTKR